MIRYALLANAAYPCFVIRYGELWHWSGAEAGGWQLLERRVRNFNPRVIRKSCLMECTLIGGVDAVV